MARKFGDTIEHDDVVQPSEGQPPLETESRELYANFLQEQINMNGLTVPDGVQLLNGGFSDPLWLCNASSLRQLAAEFSSSPLREQVRHQARSVDIRTLDSQSFGQLIQEVFQGGGVTRERVLVVFFFCSDLALMALQQQAVQVFRNLMRWSNEYITGGLTSWVRNQGGWASVLNHSVNTLLKVSATAACIVAIVCMVLFIRKNC